MHEIGTEPLADQQHHALADDRDAPAQQGLEPGTEQEHGKKAEAEPDDQPRLGRLDQVVDHQLLQFQRCGCDPGHEQRQQQQQPLLPAGDPPDRPIELVHVPFPAVRPQL